MSKSNNSSKTEQRSKRFLIALISVFISVALGLTCALCFGDMSSSVAVDGVQNGSVSTSATHANLEGDRTANGALNNNDVINYSYSNNKIYSIKLPKGTYKLEVWGGQGGYYDTGCYGGLGGYTYITTYEVTASAGQYIYIVVGGQGASGTTSTGKLGGYNGGGRTYIGNSGGGGGGASHMALVSGTLNNLSSSANQANVLLVAGGGGGSTTNAHSGTYGQGGYGGGGNNNGGASSGGYISGSGYQASGGTQSSGGAAGKGSTASACTAVVGQNGSFGKGGDSYGAANSTAGYEAGGGGGGGWYGGGGGGGDSNGAGADGRTGGGGGSGHIKSGYSGGGSNNNRSGDGYARITVINVNQAPTATGTTITVMKRGVTGSVGTINASSIATDPDATKTALAFTDGTASNLKTVTKTNSTSAGTNTTATGLYLNTACSTNASKYFNWTWTSDSSINITSVKMYPRSGMDGCTANGTIPLYARVRDTFGSQTQHGWSVIKFYVKVPVSTVATRTTRVENGGDSYFLGKSNSTTPPEVFASADKIYNPNGTNRYTLIFEQSLKYNQPFKIKASDLLTGDLTNGAFFTNDKVLIALNSTSAITGTGHKYEITEYNQNAQKVVYNSSKVRIANAFESLTFVCLTPDPQYQVLSTTLYVVETATAYTDGTQAVADIAPVTLDIVFKMDNTRPVLKDTSGDNAPVVKLKPLAQTPVNLNTYFKDVDVTSISNTTHQIKDIKVATSEYIQLDKYGKVVSTLNASGDTKDKSYFNLVTGSAALDKSILANALKTGMLEGADYKTGFEEWYISNVVSNTAYVQYSFSGTSLTLTGLRATYDMYKSGRNAATTRIATSGSVESGLTCGKTGGLNAGHFYILINVIDKNDATDQGIWLPLGIIVEDAKPTDLSYDRGSAGAGASAMPTVEGDVDYSVVFSPMGITYEHNTYALGKYYKDGQYVSADLKALGADSDNFYSPNMLNGFSVNGSGNDGRLNELLTIANINNIQGSVNGNTSGEYFQVSVEEIYIPYDYFGNRVTAANFGSPVSINYNNDPNGSTIQCIKINGIRITLKSWTHNRYLHAKATLTDTAGQSCEVTIAVKTNNSSPTAYATHSSTGTTQVAQLSYSVNGKNVKSEYRNENGVAVIEYSVPMHSRIFVTPYDLLYDQNIINSGVVYPTNGFTFNGLSGYFGNGTFSVDDKAGTSETRSKITALAVSQNTTAGNMDFTSLSYRQKLTAMLDKLNTTRTFAASSTSNLFGATLDTIKTTSIDKLYFERKDDNKNLDGYLFDPYGSSAAFAEPNVLGDMFVSYTFGNTIKFKNDSGNYDNAHTYNIDYLIITADMRTQSGVPAEIDLTVRDRTGTGASGSSAGTAKIKIKINVINSAPTVGEEAAKKIYTLRTAPIDNDPDDLTLSDMSGAISVVPTTIVINAAPYVTREELYKNFLYDNEEDTPSFYPQNGCEIRDAQNNLIDPVTKRPYTDFLRVSITSQTLTITALNSTQSVETLYVYFYATDGHSSNSRDTDTARCRIVVQVLNSLPNINNSDSGFIRGEESDEFDNLWTVESLNTNDMSSPRYFASSDKAVTELKNDGVSSGQIKTVATESDALQGIVLSPIKSPAASPDSIREYYNVTAQSPTASDYRAMVPYIAPALADDEAVGVIISINSRRPEPSTLDACVSEYEIYYYVDGNTYSASELRAGTESETVTDWSLFFDSQGRWIVTDWAVKVVPKASSIGGEYIRLSMMLRDETKFGGSSAGMSVNSYESGVNKSVDGYLYAHYDLFVNSIGIIPYTYYNQFDGYYTVTDAADSNINYISTFDGDIDSVYYEIKEGVSQYTNSIYYDAATNTINTNGTGTQLKSRAANSTDGILAGVHSGDVYKQGNDYTYEVKYFNGGSVTTSNRSVEKAFKFSDTITIDANGAYTYIPMSYFGRSQENISINSSTGEITYASNNYVAYDIVSDNGYSRLNDYYKALSISDGVTTWRGDLPADNPLYLFKNPYVSFTSFDAYDSASERANTDDIGYKAARQGNYFNHNLAMPIIDTSGHAPAWITSDTTYKTSNINNLIGNGRIMYLADQDEKLQENTFGIGIKKNYTRSTASSLTLSVAIAQCSYSNGRTSVSYNSATKAQNSATVSFKLDIGNSYIKILAAANDKEGAVASETDGYYTSISMNTDSSGKSITLSRTARVDSTGNVTTVQYEDNDVDVTDDSRSDKAYFYFDSLRSVRRWALGDPARNRVTAHNDAGDLVFTNTHSDAVAQRSMQRYFGVVGDTTLSARERLETLLGSSDWKTYQANDGIYGSNMYSETGEEGYSSYFNVSLSADGATLSITPNAKTTISTAMTTNMNDSQIRAYYAERGLVCYKETPTSPWKGYYPLKVLVYDSHGDGFLNGSYVSLEIRVNIESSEPVLSGTLSDYQGIDKRPGDKQINVSLHVNQTYSFSIYNVVSSTNLLSKNSAYFWEKDYNDLKNSVGSAGSTNGNLEDRLKLESGSYLKSPFEGWQATNNDDLRAGRAGFTDTNSQTVLSQPDVIMFMNTLNNASLTTSGVTPDGNAVTIRVNRRMTYNGSQIKDFKFSLIFTDNNGNSTARLFILVTVTNQAPTVRMNAVENARNLRMRVDDSFTVLTTPYDNFTGVLSGSTVSAQQSTSYATLTNPTRSGIGQRNLTRLESDFPSASEYARAVKYEDLNAADVDGNDTYKLHSFNSSNAEAQHLGYLALADDDTPWALRIFDITYGDESCFALTDVRDTMLLEGASAGRGYGLDAIIVARKVCTNMPIIITLVDGDDSYVSVTIYVTVESSKPSPIMDNDSRRERHKALLTTYENGQEVAGVYETYMIANSAVATKLAGVDIIDNSTNPATNKNITVYGELTLRVDEIAYDQDSNDQPYISLYDGGDEYNLFTMNGLSMDKNVRTNADGTKTEIYSNGTFEIEVEQGYAKFTIRCLTYNPYSDWDELKFYVRDVGNNIFDNAIPIKIRISTLYSSMTNKHQTAVVRGGTIYDRAIDTVYVKGYDDYAGDSVNPDPNIIIGENSTYQFVNYGGVPDSIDQDVSSRDWMIDDPDIKKGLTGSNYGVAVYAFMAPDYDTGTYTPLDIGDVSALFDLNQQKLQSGYWSFKEGVDATTDIALRDYRIGGVQTSGAAYTTNNALITFLQQYFIVDLGKDGLSLSFKPVTTTQDIKILLYVQVEKYIDRSRSIGPKSSQIKSGSLFYISVKSSAPIANNESTELSFTGKIGESHIFTIFDAENPYDSMFTDSDRGDYVVVRGFVSSGNLTSDYADALADADCDWNSRQGVTRAIDISINNTDTPIMRADDPEEVDIPAHSLKLTILRRIDKFVDGKYLEQVELPVRLKGYDRNGLASEYVTLHITIENSDLTVNDLKIMDNPNSFNSIGVGYSFSHGSDDRSYVINTRVAPDSQALSVNLVKDDWLKDPDFTSQAYDTDSYRLIRPDNENSAKYLLDGPLEIKSDDDQTVIAVITPILGNNGLNEDNYHFVGFTVEAKSYRRGLEATAYLRILDRSGNEQKGNAGVTITINVTMINAAPSLNANRPTSYTVVGKDSGAIDKITIDINDFATDRNGDELRIVSMGAETAQAIHCTGGLDFGGDIFEVDYASETELHKCVITPRNCFYGTQILSITIADGDPLSDPDARTTSFTVTINVVYDYSQITSLQNMTAIRSLPTKVTVEKLFPNISDKYDANFSTGKGVGRYVFTSADGEEKVYNPGSDYIITSLTANGSYITVSKDADDDWQFVCTREAEEILFNVTFVRKIDYDFANQTPKPGAYSYNSKFTATVGKNHQPKLLENFKRESGYIFYTRASDYGLDSSGTVELAPELLFSDEDISKGDRLLFDAKVTEVLSSTLCTVRVSGDGTKLFLTFNYRGETQLTVGVKDRTGETVKATFTIKNTDRPEASFFTKIMISYETYPFVWLGVGIGILALIVFIIILIILLKRRKRKREELEAILISEMELEEQMMRLASSSNTTPFQSFGYMPPMMNVQNDPGLMLGTGGGVPPTNNAIGLNPGAAPQQGGNAQAPYNGNAQTPYDGTPGNQGM
ncbi:MAG: hypothetical protein J1G01_05340 [Clostridiales bacterium]|nr:hypothetical protein [Clostridiales bacterium]